MTQYTSKLINGNNMYEIETTFNGEPVTFNVVVANDESELDELVEFHLNYLANPQPITPVEPPKPTLEDLQAQLNSIAAQITELQNNK